MQEGSESARLTKPEFAPLWQKYFDKNNDSVINLSSHTKVLMQSEENAVLGPRTFIELLDGYPCEISIGKFYLWKETDGFAFQRGSTLVPLFQARIRDIIESGARDRLTLEELKEKQSGQCQDNGSPDFEEIEFATISSCFLLLTSGVCVAVLVLMLELCLCSTYIALMVSHINSELLIWLYIS